MISIPKRAQHDLSDTLPHLAHQTHTITHSAAAADSTGCICSSSPSHPVECRQTPHVAASRYISPSCLCMRSLPPPPSSSPQVEMREASHPCLSTSLRFTHLPTFLEWSRHSSFLPLPLPPAVEICIPLSATPLLLFICLKIETCSSYLFSSLCLAAAEQAQEFLQPYLEDTIWIKIKLAAYSYYIIYDKTDTWTHSSTCWRVQCNQTIYIEYLWYFTCCQQISFHANTLQSIFN